MEHTGQLLGPNFQTCQELLTDLAALLAEVVPHTRTVKAQIDWIEKKKKKKRLALSLE